MRLRPVSCRQRKGSCQRKDSRAATTLPSCSRSRSSAFFLSTSNSVAMMPTSSWLIFTAASARSLHNRPHAHHECCTSFVVDLKLRGGNANVLLADLHRRQCPLTAENTRHVMQSAQVSLVLLPTSSWLTFTAASARSLHSMTTQTSWIPDGLCSCPPHLHANSMATMSTSSWLTFTAGSAACDDHADISYYAARCIDGCCCLYAQTTAKGKAASLRMGVDVSLTSEAAPPDWPAARRR